MKLRTLPDGKLFIAENGFLPKTLSVTAMNTYKNCPRDFYYKYVLGVWPDDWKPAFAIGHVVHKLLEEWYKQEYDEKVFRSILTTVAAIEAAPHKSRDDWNAVKYEKEIEMAWTMFQASLPYLPQWKPKEVEFKFQTLLQNPIKPHEVLPIPFRGVMDLVTMDDVIVDHKTAASLKDESEIKRDIQVYVYMMAFRSLFGRPPRELVYNTLLKRKRDSLTQIVAFEPDETMEAVVFEEIKSVLNGMQLGFWEAGRHTGWHGCDTCSKYPERRRR